MELDILSYEAEYCPNAMRNWAILFSLYPSELKTELGEIFSKGEASQALLSF